MVDAPQGWFVDPAGRFDGRFFDGHVWTDRVSVDGRVHLDVEWVTTDRPEASEVAVPEVAAPEVVVTQVVVPEVVAPQVAIPEVVVPETDVHEADVHRADDVFVRIEPDLPIIPSEEFSGDQDRRSLADRRQVKIRIDDERRRSDRRLPKIVIPGVATDPAGPKNVR